MGDSIISRRNRVYPKTVIRNDGNNGIVSVHGNNTKPPIELCLIENGTSSTETVKDVVIMEAVLNHGKEMAAEVTQIQTLHL